MGDMKRGSSVVAVATVHATDGAIPSTDRLIGLKNAGFKDVVRRRDGRVYRTMAK